MRIVIAAGRVLELACGNERAAVADAFADDGLLAIGRRLVRILVEIAYDTVDIDALEYIGADNAVVVSGFQEVFVIIICGLVRQLERTPHIGVDGLIVGREREKELVKHTYVVTRLDRSVLHHVLLKCQDKALTPVQHVYLLPRLFNLDIRKDNYDARE